jgi:subtilase family serine protease
MRNRLVAGAIATLGLFTAVAAAGPGQAAQADAGPVLVPQAVQAPDAPGKPGAAGDACTAPTPDPSGTVTTYAWIHCYTPAQIAAAYGVDALHAAENLGAGQTIVLLDAYGSPTARQDLQKFHDTFFPALPSPNFDVVYPQGPPDFQNGCHGNGTGLSGPCAAAGWSGEATLDIEWAYAIAPRAHIVLIGVPPAETEGVQGFPNLFKALQQAIDTYPAGTVISQSFGVTEQTFGGAAQVQTARFDAIYRAAAAKGDTVLASSGDDGSTGAAKQHGQTATYPFPTVGWPASSPYVTAVGGTQLQYGWTWQPASDVPFLANGDYNPAYFAFTSGGNSEPVWNETWLPAATGGGPSVIYPRPAWQAQQAPIIGRDARGVPDLSWNAAVNGGVLVWITAFPGYQRSGWHVYGGTSAASPQVAGLIALANEQQAAAAQPPLGFLNPLLYRVGDQPGAATAAFGGGGSFRDIVPHTYGTAASGVLADNRLWQYNADGSVSPGPVPGWPTLPGWDMTTGFGSPRAAAFVAAIRAARNTP